MKHDQDRLVGHFADENGRLCARVRLANSDATAAIYVEDLDALRCAGFTLNWSHNADGHHKHGYVRANLPGLPLQTLARWITKAGRGERVRYLDGNTLNLRGNNLRVEKAGTAKTNCAALVEVMTALHGRAT